MNDLKSRIEALETKIGQMNTEIAALQKIVDDAVTVVKVEKGADGYVIYFSDNTTAEIKNGTAGADAPVIGVKQDTDEVYYWTITTDGKTEWLMAGGAKLRVTGESVKPVMSVDDEGYWTISYDGGKTSERILDAAGDPVSAVTEGSSIGSLFKSVNYDDNNVYFELVDGTIITISKTGSQSSNIIIFADKDVKKRCVGLWDTNGDGELSHEEVAAVTTIGTVFQNNTDIEFFNELKHFSGLTALEANAFSGCSNLCNIAIPANVFRSVEQPKTIRNIQT